MNHADVFELLTKLSNTPVLMFDNVMDRCILADFLDQCVDDWIVDSKQTKDSRWRDAPSIRRCKLSRALVWVVGLASLFYFNRNAEWDNWAVYFFGAYGLGALTYWFSQLASGRARR